MKCLKSDIVEEIIIIHGPKINIKQMKILNGDKLDTTAGATLEGVMVLKT